jgi:hypothetical protein
MIDNSENQLKAEVAIPEVSRTEASNWHDTDWNYVNKKVFNLQKQIAKAEREARGGKVKRMQNLLTRSLAAKRLAVSRVTENQGAKTPGVDGETWNTPTAKALAIQDTVIMPAPKKGLSRLERHEVKISRAVLRGGSGGNVTLLPGR